MEAEIQNRAAGHQHVPGEADEEDEEHEHAAPADTAKAAPQKH